MKFHAIRLVTITVIPIRLSILLTRIIQAPPEEIYLIRNYYKRNLVSLYTYSLSIKSSKQIHYFNNTSY